MKKSVNIREISGGVLLLGFFGSRFGIADLMRKLLTIELRLIFR
jgi:hypothetical protein